MNLLVCCPHFDPDTAPTGVVMTSLVRELARRGHRIHVVTALPWYRHHRVEPEWQGRVARTETTEWGWITRLHPFPTDKTNIPARALAFAGFTALVGGWTLRPRLRPDVVVVMSPPLVLGLPGISAAKVARAPLVCNIQDVFPDIAEAVGAITNPRILKAAAWLERRIYRHSAAVTVLSEDLRRNVAAKLPPADVGKVRVIPNFVDTDRIRPGAKRNAYREEFGLGDRTVVMYAGNVGYSQPLWMVVDAAQKLAHRSDVVFVINGGGSALAGLQRRGGHLPNLVFVPPQPADRLAEVLAAADLHLVLLKPGLASCSVPSKLYSVLAAGRPVLAGVDPDTEVSRVLGASGAGTSVAPEDADGFVNALSGYLDDPERCEREGAAGRAWVEGWPSPADIAERYEALFEELLAEDVSPLRGGNGPAAR